MAFKVWQAAGSVWDEDIVCLPKALVRNPQDSPNPRGESLAKLAKMGLVEKIQLCSNMDEDDIRHKIFYIFFLKPMDHSTTFTYEERHQLLLSVYIFFFLR